MYYSLLYLVIFWVKLFLAFIFHAMCVKGPPAVMSEEEVHSPVRDNHEAITVRALHVSYHGADRTRCWDQGLLHLFWESNL